MASLSTTQPTITSAVKQNISAQDFAFSGSSENFDYIGVADEHGKVLNALYPTTIFKNLIWDTFLQSPTYFQTIIEKTSVFETNGVGSTLCICKIYDDRFEFSWVGDSTGKLYKNGECIFKTLDHDRNNVSENLRLNDDWDVVVQTEKKGQPIWDIEIVNPTTIKSVKATLYNFRYNNTINFTHALGHAGVTGKHFSTETIPREKDASYKVVCGTDGLWAMVCEEDSEFVGKNETTAENLVELAAKRWRQEWNHDNGSFITKGARFPEHNIDDVGAACWQHP